MDQPLINHLDLYRLPWNYADNGISWLEPTTKCNLRCAGCYRDLENPVHKSMTEMRAELGLFKRLRKSDCMSIAGGDPLLYPQIVELVALIHEMGWKPIINTNGLALDENLLKRLKAAGAFGFTFHIDTSQNRPKAKGKSETELNAERLKYAQMLARAGNLTCSFNATITDKTLHEIPALVEWAAEHADIVQTMVFILFRSPQLLGEFDYLAGRRTVDLGATYDNPEWGGERGVRADEVVQWIRQGDPLYRPAAYLNGTANPAALKWLLATRLIVGGRVIGYLPPRLVELAQTFSHILRKRYLAYPATRQTRRGKSVALAGALIERSMRQNLGRLLWEMFRRPKNLFRRAHLQSITVIQPVNFEPNGRQDMCDGCPDITVHDGKLVWSCRLEELNKYGAFVEAVPRQKPQKKKIPLAIAV